MKFGDLASDGRKALVVELDVDSPGVVKVEKKLGSVGRIHVFHLRVLPRDASMAPDKIASEHIPRDLLC